MEAQHIIGAIAVGIGATLLVDLWNLFLKGVFNIRSLDYCLLGRWLCHMPDGTFTHAKITGAHEKPFECAIGWIAHYSIGTMLALIFVLIQSADWFSQPAFLPAFLYGIGTVVFPLFILQPSLGLGIASSKTPRPTQARLKSLLTHTVFGVGLWACSHGVAYLLPA